VKPTNWETSISRRVEGNPIGSIKVEIQAQVEYFTNLDGKR